MKVIIDNGHGDDTKGKRSPNWHNGIQLFEWEFNRDIAVELYDLLRAEGIATTLLVHENEDIPIKERVRRANEIHKAEESILVSIHGNAAPKMNAGPHGIETFYYSLSGKVLALKLQKKLVAALGWKDRGARKAYRKIKTNVGTDQEKFITTYKIAILKYTNMLAVLTESGFYTNFEQCQEMMKEEVRNTIAQAHADAIIEYISNLNN
jgi:N-acetylmuramoyl-L-alanine amidase